VLAAINKLKSNLSAGPDGLPRLLFKRVKHAITGPLALVFRQLLSVSCMSDEWKNDVITPVHKKGSSSRRGHLYKIFKHFCNSSVRSNFFAERVINLWNNLPPDRVNFGSFSCFKRSVKLINFPSIIH